MKNRTKIAIKFGTQQARLEQRKRPLSPPKKCTICPTQLAPLHIKWKLEKASIFNAWQAIKNLPYLTGLVWITLHRLHHFKHHALDSFLFVIHEFD